MLFQSNLTFFLFAVSLGFTFLFLIVALSLLCFVCFCAISTLSRNWISFPILLHWSHKLYPDFTHSLLCISQLNFQPIACPHLSSWLLPTSFGYKSSISFRNSYIFVEWMAFYKKTCSKVAKITKMCISLYLLRQVIISQWLLSLFLPLQMNQYCQDD